MKQHTKRLSASFKMIGCFCVFASLFTSVYSGDIYSPFSSNDFGEPHTYMVLGIKPTPVIIKPNNSKIQYLGRIDKKDPMSPALGWEGCEIRAGFTGTSLKMILSSSEEHYFNIIIDGDTSTITKLRLVSANEVTYTLAFGLDNKRHTVSIFKRTPSLQVQYFKGFILDASSVLFELPHLPVRKIEFYGDSQLSGDAIECAPGKDTYEATYFNNYLAYGAVAARLLNAQYSCIAQGGGEISRHFPVL